jgi:3-oxoacyl-[acyl-carrier protein] reductase
MTKQTILITGAAQGIGLHLAHVFLKKNYNVVAADIDILRLQTAFEGQNTEGVILQKLDVSKVEDWQKAMAELTQRFGHLDICINNAGVIHPNFLAQLTPQEIDNQLDVNVKGVMLGTKFAADAMRPQGFGHIINFASLAGVAPIHGLPVYAATKNAVRAFTLSVAFELREQGIFTSVICPDLVNTQMLTLQLDYAAANMTFSGQKILTVQDIEKAVFKRALERREVEILVPRHRGWLGKIGNLFPVMGFKLAHFLSEKGRKRRIKLKEDS